MKRVRNKEGSAHSDQDKDIMLQLLDTIGCLPKAPSSRWQWRVLEAIKSRWVRERVQELEEYRNEDCQTQRGRTVHVAFQQRKYKVMKNAAIQQGDTSVLVSAKDFKCLAVI